jgi:predicted O-methyltransferase YrrM
MESATSLSEIKGQLNDEERRLLTDAIVEARKKPEVVLEVGTWLGGGSTLHILRALERNGVGHLWGIEADHSIYEQMLENIGRAAPEAIRRFVPLFGFSHEVIPVWLKGLGPEAKVDLVFLDGGNNPGEQIEEFHLLDPHIPIGGQLLAHDAKLRKGKWLAPYLRRLDNWQVQIHDVSEHGLLYACKVAPRPSGGSRRAAGTCLLKMRCNPIEIAAAVLPSRVCGFVLGLLPPRVARQLSDGCK